MEPLETDLLLVCVWCVSLEEILVIQFSDETFVLCLDEGFISGSQNELILEFKSSSYKLITSTIEKRENITTSNPLPPYPNKGKKNKNLFCIDSVERTVSSDGPEKWDQLAYNIVPLIVT